MIFDREKRKLQEQKKHKDPIRLDPRVLFVLLITFAPLTNRFPSYFPDVQNSIFRYPIPRMRGRLIPVGCYIYNYRCESYVGMHETAGRAGCEKCGGFHFDSQSDLLIIVTFVLLLFHSAVIGFIQGTGCYQEIRMR
jgi:hypothetical protein